MKNIFQIIFLILVYLLFEIGTIIFEKNGDEFDLR